MRLGPDLDRMLRARERERVWAELRANPVYISRKRLVIRLDRIAYLAGTLIAFTVFVWAFFVVTQVTGWILLTLICSAAAIAAGMICYWNSFPQEDQ